MSCHWPPEIPSGLVILSLSAQNYVHMQDKVCMPREPLPLPLNEQSIHGPVSFDEFIFGMVIALYNSKSVMRRRGMKEIQISPGTGV